MTDGQLHFTVNRVAGHGLAPATKGHAFMPTLTPQSRKTSRAERIGEAVTAAYIHELARPMSFARPVALHTAPARLRSHERSRRLGVERRIAA
jgi:hypothetical protein